MLTYTEARSFMNGCARFGSVPGLENIKNLCTELGNPQNKLQIIHIGGTNGKGSVGAYLASILMHSGFRVGRYVSPAVMCKREVFSVNSIPVSEESYARAVSMAYDGVQQLLKKNLPHPTQFEIETAAAFECFIHEKCDIVLIEVGMGGRLDSTNIIEKPLLSVLAHIGMDHMAFLGDTLEKITAEKAGIIKNNVPLVSTTQELISTHILEDKCKKLNSPIYYADKTQIIKSDFDGIEFLCGNYTLDTSMCGAYQCDNAAVAVKCAEVLCSIGYTISDDDIKNGIKSAAWGGRFELLRKKPPFIVDGAHNPDGAEKLAQSIKLHFGNKKPCFVFGVFKDKDYEKIAELTAPLASHIYTVTPPPPRGLTATELSDTVRKYNPDVTACSEISEAINKAVQCKDGVVCFGSLSFLAQIKELIIKDGDTVCKDATKL